LEWVTLWTTLSGKDPRKFRIVALAVMSFLLLIQALFIIFFWVSQNQNLDFYNHSWGGNIDQIAISFYSFLVAVLFLIYGQQFSGHMKTVTQLSHATSNTKMRLSLKKVNYVSLLCTLSFAIRFVFWLYGTLVYEVKIVPRGSVEAAIDQALYPTMWYTVPDIVPSLALLKVLCPNYKDRNSGQWSVLDTELLPGSQILPVLERDGDDGCSLRRNESEITSLTNRDKPIDRDLESNTEKQSQAWHESRASSVPNHSFINSPSY